jgi:hypothetical protein
VGDMLVCLRRFYRCVATCIACVEHSKVKCVMRDVGYSVDTCPGYSDAKGECAERCERLPKVD